MEATQTEARERYLDGRIFLKVKAKSLAEEARIIRKEERRAKGLRDHLRDHRTGVVRSEARATLLAYGFLRGRTLEQVETRAKTKPDWDKVWSMVRRYCLDPVDLHAVRRKERLAETEKAFGIWKLGK